VEIELVPDPGAGDPAGQAAAAALEQEGLVGNGRPSAYDGAWRSAGLLEAVERDPCAGGGEFRPPAGYALPARSTAGATRA
jgi:hypothetical protein